LGGQGLLNCFGTATEWDQLTDAVHAKPDWLSAWPEFNPQVD